MAAVRQFEELKIWQEARAIAMAVYSLTRKSAFAKDYGLKDQIQRAAVIEAAMKYIDSRKVGRASTRPPRRFHRNRPTDTRQPSQTLKHYLL